MIYVTVARPPGARFRAILVVCRQLAHLSPDTYISVCMRMYWEGLFVIFYGLKQATDAVHIYPRVVLSVKAEDTGSFV